MLNFHQGEIQIQIRPYRLWFIARAGGKPIQLSPHTFDLHHRLLEFFYVDLDGNPLHTLHISGSSFWSSRFHDTIYYDESSTNLWARSWRAYRAQCSRVMLPGADKSITSDLWAPLSTIISLWAVEKLDSFWNISTKTEKPTFNTGTGTPALFTDKLALNLILTATLVPPMKGLKPFTKERVWISWIVVKESPIHFH